MSRRKQASGGQAIVMVTLALVSMCGMMGLAVDLGWSFFVQKTAQASADGAALAAVQETIKLNGGNGLGSISCGLVASCTAAVGCDTIGSGNLYNGCLYATANGFTVGGEGGRQNVTIEASVTVPAPTVPNVTDIKYWVTVRTFQSVPQLFSAVLGNTQGTVSAIATAAIAGSQLPGSFYGMNHAGDCLTGFGPAAKAAFNCGVDIDLSSSNGSTVCTNVDGSSSGVSAKLCAPAGIYLSSICNGTSTVGCGSGSSGATGTNFAGQTSGSVEVWAQSGTQIAGNGYVNDVTDWLPANTLTRQSTGASSDPLRTLPQPPIVSPSQPTCAVTNGILPSSTVGPYQYYAVDGAGNATGLPIRIIGNGTTTFDPGSTNCPGNNFGNNAGTGSFKTFTFWGGLDINGNSTNQRTVTMGAGQYVMAGTSSTNGAVFSALAATIAGANSGTAPTMFLMTDGNYSAQGTSLTKPAAMNLINLKQGFTDIKNADFSLEGITSATPLSDYKGILLWQDRRNSNLTLDPTNGDFVSQARPANVTDTSPQIYLESGNAALRLDGLLYQPRGAWFSLDSGGEGASTNLRLKMVTGALTCGTGCGSASITLKGPGAPTTVYVTSLIQ